MRSLALVRYILADRTEKIVRMIFDEGYKQGGKGQVVRNEQPAAVSRTTFIDFR